MHPRLALNLWQSSCVSLEGYHWQVPPYSVLLYLQLLYSGTLYGIQISEGIAVQKDTLLVAGNLMPVEKIGSDAYRPLLGDR